MSVLKRMPHVLAVLALLAAGPARAPANEWSELEEKLAAERKEWSAQVRGATDPSTRPVDPILRYVPKARELAERDMSKPAAFGPLSFLVQSASAVKAAGQPIDDAVWALRAITREYATHEDVWRLFSAVRFGYDVLGAREADAFFEAVRERHADSAVQLRAALAHANAIAEADEGDAEANRRRAVEMLRPLTKLEDQPESADAAARLVFELENLQVGRPAPDIVGQDVNEKEIRLSQFRGNVVVLDFWGFW